MTQRKAQGMTGGKRVRCLDGLMKLDVKYGLPVVAGKFAGTDIFHKYTPGREQGWMGAPATQCWYCYGWADDWRHV